MTTEQQTPEVARGDILERPVPGTGMARWEIFEILALPGDEDFYCGGALNASDFVLIRDERGAEYPLHRMYLKAARA